MNTETASILNDLIKISKDGEQGFKAAAEDTSNENLKNIFLGCAEECSSAVQELQQQVTKMNVEPEDSGSMLGALHRGWMNVKSAITGRDDHAILEECERGEDVAKATYSKALNQYLPEDIRDMVQQQYDIVIKNHDLIRDLRDQYAAKNQTSSR